MEIGTPCGFHSSFYILHFPAYTGFVKPNRTEEKKLHRQGFRHIAGLDEAGRGAWAGPLVAAAVILPENNQLDIPGDSKQVRPSLRKKLFVDITKNAVAWAVSVIDADVIDHEGIHVVNLRALMNAANRLAVRPDYLLIDGWRLPADIPHHALIRGDEMVQSIAAASIVAKVVRDTLMEDFHRLYPKYDFHLHKGYGTHRHIVQVAAHGMSPIHRLSFAFSPREYLRRHSLAKGDVL